MKCILIKKKRKTSPRTELYSEISEMRGYKKRKNSFTNTNNFECVLLKKE